MVMDSVSSVIYFIAIPSVLIFTFIISIFKKKTYAINACALYFFIIGSYFLYQDVNHSISLIISGIIILCAAYTMLLKQYKYIKIIQNTSLILIIIMLILYGWIWETHSYHIRINYSFSKECKNIITNPQDNKTNFLPPQECYITVNVSPNAYLPINKEIKITLCSNKGEILGASYYQHYSSNNKYIIPIYTTPNNLKSAYLCASYKDELCGECIAKKEISIQ